MSADREEHGKKPFDDDPPNAPVEEKEIVISTTDPDCGVFHKGDHKKCFAYGVQTACDRHNYILGVDVHAGNMHDSVAFDGIYNQVAQRFPEISVVTMDARYKTPWICKRIIEDGRIPSLPYKRPMTKEGNHEWWKYVYDEYYDCVICPEYSVLNYSTTNRNGYREYKSDPNVCRNCPTRHLCTASKQYQKLVTLHIWRDFVEQAEDIRHTPLGKKSYEKRKETIERVFADAKEKYAMRYTPYRGLTAVTNWVKLKYAAMNLKKFVIHRWKDTHPSLRYFVNGLFHIQLHAKSPIPA